VNLINTHQALKTISALVFAKMERLIPESAVMVAFKLKALAT
jgi:hypothetical protein